MVPGATRPRRRWALQRRASGGSFEIEGFRRLWASPRAVHCDPSKNRGIPGGSNLGASQRPRLCSFEIEVTAGQTSGNGRPRVANYSPPDDSIPIWRANVRPVLGHLTRATNLLSHGLDDRITELGIGTPEYLVLLAAGQDPHQSTAQIRRSLAMRDAAFSDVVRRCVYRGYVVARPYPGDRRSRCLELTFPGSQATHMAWLIHRELEAAAGVGPWMIDIADRLDQLGRRLAAVPPAGRYDDGLPLATA